MGRSIIKLNHGGIQSYLDGGHGVSALLHSHAEAVRDAAQADPHDDTGDYERGIIIRDDHTDRLAVRVVATDWKSYILEAEYGILSRALDAAG